MHYGAVQRVEMPQQERPQHVILNGQDIPAHLHGKETFTLVGRENTSSYTLKGIDGRTQQYLQQLASTGTFTHRCQLVWVMQTMPDPKNATNIVEEPTAREVA